MWPRSAEPLQFPQFLGWSLAMFRACVQSLLVCTVPDIVVEGG